MADALKIACLCEENEFLLMSSLQENDVKGLNLEDLSEEQFYSFFWFQRKDIPRLCDVLSLPSISLLSSPLFCPRFFSLLHPLLTLSHRPAEFLFHCTLHQHQI